MSCNTMLFYIPIMCCVLNFDQSFFRAINRQNVMVGLQQTIEMVGVVNRQGIGCCRILFINNLDLVGLVVV